MKVYHAAGFRLKLERFPHGCDKRRWWTGYRLPFYLNYGRVGRHLSIGDASLSFGSRGY